ncbi:MAG: hypothetical protein KDC34_16275 [Saprospiraceae bacterium]|nr:hypothetical protein [Saprospiraceae bacterium]
MKICQNILLLSAFALLAFAGCKNEPTDQDDPAASDGTAVIKDAEEVAVGDMPIVTGPGGQISPQTLAMVESLTRDYWYVEQWVEINQGSLSREAANANRGRWFQFDDGGKITMGKLKSTVDSGKWEYDPQTARLSMDMGKEDDMEFTLKMTPDGKVMLWVGTDRFNQNNVQLKLENYVELMSEMPVVTN